MANYRLQKYTRNPNYLFPQYHKLYDIQGIDEGQGPGMNPNLDSALRHSNMVNLPDDRLTEKVTFVRYVDFLPDYVLNPEYAHDRFLVSTTIPIDPQRRFNPEFDRYGVNCRHYNRLTDEYFRQMGNKSNKYRKPAKYYR